MRENLSPAEIFALKPEAERLEFLESLTDEEVLLLEYDWNNWWARPNQRAPSGDWLVWLVLAGRGFGKTRIGSEWIRSMVCGPTPLSKGKAHRIALVAETAADGRDVMVEGDSGILSCHPKDFRPTYQPTKRRLTWPNGAIATVYNGTEPDQLRGPQHDLAWADEIAKWRYITEAWDQLQFGMRLGQNPQQCVTTTPRPIKLIKELMARAARGEGVVVTTGSTMENAANLAAPFLKEVRKRYEGTRLGRQELNAEILGDAPGALWTQSNLDEWRRPQAPLLKRTVVAIDPAVTSGEEANEHGIIGAGVGADDDRGYILEDASVSGSPKEWARAAISLYHRIEADMIVVETNNGGDMAEAVIRSVSPDVPVTQVKASKGKWVRAEPVSSLYEQGRISHIGQLPKLEDQMMQMTNAGYQGDDSPDRCDALVWAITELFPDISEPITVSKEPEEVKGRIRVGWMN